MSMVTCLPISTWVYEKGRTLRLVRSGNVFAAGMELDDSGVLVRFCNKRDSGTLYLYPGAAATDLDALPTSRSSDEACEGRPPERL